MTVGDTAVNQAYDGLGDTYKYYWSTYQRDSIDGQGMPLQGLVHYGTNYVIQDGKLVRQGTDFYDISPALK